MVDFHPSTGILNNRNNSCIRFKSCRPYMFTWSLIPLFFPLNTNIKFYFWILAHIYLHIRRVLYIQPSGYIFGLISNMGRIFTWEALFYFSRHSMIFGPCNGYEMTLPLFFRPRFSYRYLPDRVPPFRLPSAWCLHLFLRLYTQGALHSPPGHFYNTVADALIAHLRHRRILADFKYRPGRFIETT